jgi:hypothetical protein
MEELQAISCQIEEYPRQENEGNRIEELEGSSPSNALTAIIAVID